jgi:GNAT superfamily N-acetyltransferase
MTIEIRRIPYTPEVFAPLMDEAEAGNVGFLLRLRDEWGSGALRFERPGEFLLGALAEGTLLGVGGVSHDPYEPTEGLGRVRHVYVVEARRRQGIARRLMTEVLRRASSSFKALRLRTGSAEAAALYESIGFRRSDRSGETHRLQISSDNRP